MKLLFQTVMLLCFASPAFAAKHFVYCSEGSPTSFNPQQASDGTTYNASSHTMYNRLVEFKKGSVEIEAGLAESWTISKDALTYTFKLRPGVKFHSNAFFKPARFMNADDIIYSFDVQHVKDHPLGQKNAIYEYYDSMDMQNIIKSITKTDDLTVVFKLSHPEAPFLANLAMDFASIVSREYAEQLVKAGKPIATMNTAPIGTGPFVFKSYQKDNVIRFTANPDYFGGKPKIENLIFAITPDPNVRLQKLKAGECNFIIEPSPQDLDRIAKMPGIKLDELAGLNIGFLAFNTQKKPFTDVRVRQALRHAMDKESYIKAIYLGRAIVAKNPMPPQIWGYNNDTVDADYNIETSKRLLREAGYPNGFDIELWTMPVSRAYNPSSKKLGEMIQADFAKVRVRVQLINYDWSTFLAKTHNGEHVLMMGGWTGDNGDPDNFMYILLGCEAVKGGTNVARWCDKSYDSLVTQAKYVTDQKKRTALYLKAQEIFAAQGPWAPIAHAKTYRAMSKNVTGYVMHPFGGDVFTGVDLQ